MKCVIPEISWHNRDPVLSVDFQVLASGSSSDVPCYRLATGGSDTHVLIWLVKIVKKGADVHLEFASDLKRHNRAVNVVRFSPSGEMLASGDDEGVIWLWKQQDHGQKDMGGDLFDDDDEKENKEHWRATRTLRGHIEDVYDLCWSPNSDFLISGSVDNSAIIWDIAKGRSICLLSEHKGFVQGVAWDPQNQYVATLCSDRYTFETIPGIIASKKVVHKIHKAHLTAASTSPKLQHDDADPNMSTPRKASKLFHDDTLKSFFRRLTFTPDGELLITPSGVVELDSGNILNVTHVFSLQSPMKPAFYLPSKNKHTLAVRCCPNFFQLRPVKQKSMSRDEAQEQPWEIYSTLLKLPYRMVFAVATQESVLFYDTQQPMPFAKVDNIQYTQLSDLSWSSDGRILIVSSTDGYCSFITFEEKELGLPYEKVLLKPETVITPALHATTTLATTPKSVSEAKLKDDHRTSSYVTPTSSTIKSLITEPITSSTFSQQNAIHKRVSLITLFSPKSANQTNVINSAEIVTSVQDEKKVKTCLSEERDGPVLVSMDVDDCHRQVVSVAAHCSDVVVTNKNEIEAGPLDEAVAVVKELCGVVEAAEMNLADQSNVKAALNKVSVSSNDLNTLGAPTKDDKYTSPVTSPNSSSDKRPIIPAVERKPRRVQFITLSAPTKRPNQDFEAEVKTSRPTEV